MTAGGAIEYTWRRDGPIRSSSESAALHAIASSWTPRTVTSPSGVRAALWLEERNAQAVARRRVARNRCLKLDFWSHESAARVGRDARLLLLALSNHADDHGRFRAHPRLVRGQAFPLDDRLMDGEVAGWLDELSRHGLIRLYSDGGQSYGWMDFDAPEHPCHQKPEHRGRPQFPAPPVEPERQASLFGEASAPVAKRHETAATAAAATGTRAVASQSSGVLGSPHSGLSTGVGVVIGVGTETAPPAASRPRWTAQQRGRAIGAFKAAFLASYGEKPTFEDLEARALIDALTACADLDAFCDRVVPGYLGDRDQFLVDARHHPRLLRGRIDRYRLRAPGAGLEGVNACPHCRGPLDDGRPTIMTGKGMAHAACADQARRAT